MCLTYARPLGDEGSADYIIDVREPRHGEPVRPGRPL